MRFPSLRLAAIAAVSGIPLSGCAYDMYGNSPYGYGPYSGVSVGVGYGGGYRDYGYYDPYYYYGGYGYPYGRSYYGYNSYSPFGWYGNYYYPGSGIYVYDRHRTRHVWSDAQRRYWEQRRNRSGTTSGTTTTQNWSGFNRPIGRWVDRNSATTTTTSVTSSGSRTRHVRERSAVTTSSTDRMSTRSNNGVRGRSREGRTPDQE
jgi:hypothetical protein